MARSASDLPDSLLAEFKRAITVNIALSRRYASLKKRVNALEANQVNADAVKELRDKLDVLLLSQKQRGGR